MTSTAFIQWALGAALLGLSVFCLIGGQQALGGICLALGCLNCLEAALDDTDDYFD